MAIVAVACLIAITPGAVFVTTSSALIIDAMTSIICFYSVHLKIQLKFDDSLDTFAV